MPRAIGPLPRFADAHVKMALELIGKHKRIGRKQLAEELGVGEGSMRTILDQLKKRGLITSSRGGHSLTAKGEHTLSKPFEFVQVNVGDLTMGKVNIATVVRGAATKVMRGIEQRDEAIKAGADGATVLIFKRGRLRFPDEFFEVKKGASDALLNVLHPREGDIVVIGSAGDAVKAEAGAKAAARSLSKSRQR